ncbi:hypothetical protein EOPP23_12145 [Endozoicomonas sp. OPT23]|uniref:hypothetical protein n=1 Tax=Endozoicomonas sp. OPT23 TaxID=2072845 RepID=UPI00129ADDFF|nr:hypothetical protein [Endozoicomonas sp. OPT23]MRI33738.1 hypothetical protein [Endozoicomonas sp. OPT23]
MTKPSSESPENLCYHPRNWQGYGGKPPFFQWPDNVRLVINLVLNYEKRAERDMAAQCTPETRPSHAEFSHA